MTDFIITPPICGHQLADEVFQATGINVTDRYSYYPDEQIVRIMGADVEAQSAAIQAVIDAHVPNPLYFPEDVARFNMQDVINRLNLNALAGKTPVEIYQIVQARIDGWGNLAQAKVDMRDYFPLLFAAVFWLVKQDN